jgi:hypothetical protein
LWVLELGLKGRREDEAKGREGKGRWHWGPADRGWRKSENKPIKTCKSSTGLRTSVKIRETDKKSD